MPSVSVMRESSTTHSAETPRLTKVRQARTALAAQGLDEAVTWSFMNGDLAEKFGGQDAQAAKSLTISNPINAEMDRMRPSLLPNLIQAATRNAARGFPDAALFEVGPAFITAKPDGQKTVAAGIRHGLAVPRHWGTKDAGRKVDALDAKADAFAVLNACGFNAETAQITRDAPAWYHPARSGTLRLGANVLAYFGDLHPAVLDDMDIKGAVAGFEVFLDSIPQPKKKSAAKTHLTLPPLQPVNRDFAFIVDAAVEAETLVKTIKAVDKTLVARVDVFDVYVGKGIEDGKKSVALSVMLQPLEKTLTDAELEAVASKIVKSVEEKTKGTLRG
jgi:phenylalanyl-tRNA synthetase beta chain